MSDDSAWDEAFTSFDPADWEDIIGEPPDWYFPLIGRIAIATGGLERRYADTALRLLGWSQERGGDVYYWLSSTSRLKTLLGAANGLSPTFDELARESNKAWEKRNAAVHVATGWHDFEAPDQPSGWHYEQPRSKKRVYLNNGAREALEAILASIEDLDQRVWTLYLSLR